MLLQRPWLLHEREIVRSQSFYHHFTLFFFHFKNLIVVNKSPNMGRLLPVEMQPHPRNLLNRQTLLYQRRVQAKIPANQLRLLNESLHHRRRLEVRHHRNKLEMHHHRKLEVRHHQRRLEIRHRLKLEMHHHHHTHQ